MRGAEKRRVGFVVSGAFAVAEVRHEFVVRVEDRDLAAKVGNIELALVLVKTTRVAHVIGQRALVVQFEVKDFEPVVMPVGDINFRPALLEGIDPDAVAGVERTVVGLFAGLRTAPADSSDMFEILVEPADALAAVTVHHIDVAVRGDSHVGRIGPVEFLRRAAFPDDITNFVKDFAFEVGLIDALAEFWAFLVRADVFGEVDEFLPAFLAHIEAVRRVLDLISGEADLVGKIVAPGFQQFALAVEDGDAWIGGTRRDINAVFGIHHHSATEAVLHSFGQFAPVFVERVGMMTGADANGDFLLSSGDQAWHNQAGGRNAGHFEEVSAGQPTWENIFVHVLCLLLEIRADVKPMRKACRA